MPKLLFEKIRVAKQTIPKIFNKMVPSLLHCELSYWLVSQEDAKSHCFSQREEFLKSESARFSTLLVEPAGVDCWHWLVGSNCSLRAPFTDPQSRSRPATCVVTYFQQEVHSSFSKLNLQDVLSSKEVYYAV